MITEQGRIPSYNQLTPLEYGYFTTKPEEVGQPFTTLVSAGSVQADSTSSSVIKEV